MISACVSCISSLSSSSLGLFLFMLTCSMMRFLSLLLLGLCPCGVSVVMWYVCEVVMVPYVVLFSIWQITTLSFPQCSLYQIGSVKVCFQHFIYIYIYMVVVGEYFDFSLLCMLYNAT